jgi:hypothetical protein
MKKHFKYEIILLLLLLMITSCSSSGNDFESYRLEGRWVSKKDGKYQIWFQDWSNYTRLFMSIKSDTLKMMPNKYAALTKGKEYLFPKEYTQVLKNQYIGNISWEDAPNWEKSRNKKFKWEIDRANPKVDLPMNYYCEATFDDKKNLNLKVTNESKILYDIDLKYMLVY